MIYDKKDAKTPLECFEQMNMGFCEFYQNIKYKWGRIIEFSIAQFRFVINFVVIPQTLE